MNEYKNANKTKQEKYLHILNKDRKGTICAVSCKEILTATGEGEKLVVKGLEVRLAHHQALTYTQAPKKKQKK